MQPEATTGSEGGLETAMPGSTEDEEQNANVSELPVPAPVPTTSEAVIGSPEPTLEPKAVMEPLDSAATTQENAPTTNLPAPQAAEEAASLQVADMPGNYDLDLHPT